MFFSHHGSHGTLKKTHFDAQAGYKKPDHRLAAADGPDNLSAAERKALAIDWYDDQIDQTNLLIKDLHNLMEYYQHRKHAAQKRTI